MFDLLNSLLFGEGFIGGNSYDYETNCIISYIEQMQQSPWYSTYLHSDVMTYPGYVWFGECFVVNMGYNVRDKCVNKSTT